MAPDVHQANRRTVERMTSARPRLTGVGVARESIPDMGERQLLHAGPPIGWDRMSGPLRGAVVGAAIFEGWADDEEAATAMAGGGEIDFAPCHHYHSVGPMAGVTSPSMAVYRVENPEHGNVAFSNLNEGYGKVLRYGAYAPEVLEKLHWMNDVVGPMINTALAELDGIDMRTLIAEALHMGDDCHNRCKAASVLYAKTLAPAITATAEDRSTAAEVLTFLGDNALSVLNPVMAACKAMADAAHGVEGSTVVSTMARNGTEIGIRVSGLGEDWFTAPSPTPDGLYFSGFSSEDANPDIGDSTITETAGIGAFAMAGAPAIVTFVSGTPRDALDATLEMYEITAGEHPHFTVPPLDFRGTPVGIDLRRVVELGITPRINTGIAHREAGIGQVGAGLVRPPVELFQEALVAYAERYGL
ncbi:MAG: DUF1116 domain-containing protein [Thermoanaerobaculia bacterium]